MFVVTHALVPVVACIAADLGGLRFRGERIFPPKSLALVGVFGVLPDLCSPHISLAARYASWSHTLWFMIGLIPAALFAASFFERRFLGVVAAACWSASLLHLAADAISGGIAWLHPWRPDILGARLIPFRFWFVGDLLFLVLVLFGLWLLPRFEAAAIKRA
jgi:hypothetical protein